jgi:hypothetical protein
MGKALNEDNVKDVVRIVSRVFTLVHNAKPKPGKKKNDGEDDDNELAIQAVLDALKDNGITMDRASLKDPAMINKLGALMAVATLAKDDPGVKGVLGLILAEPHQLDAKQNAQLCMATEFIKAMEKNPSFKPNLGLLLKDPAEMSKEEKAQLQTDIKATLITNNPQMGLKQLEKLSSAVMQELEKPGTAKENLEKQVNAAQSGQSAASNSKAAATAKADFARNLFGGEGLLSVMPNALGIADDFPEYSANSPLANLSGSVFSPSQAATGEEAIEAQRDLEMGLENDFDSDYEASGEVSLDDVGMDLLSDTVATATDTANPEAESAIELDDIQPTLGEPTSPDVNEPSAFTEAVGEAFEQNNINTYDSPSPTPPGGGSGGGGG